MTSTLSAMTWNLLEGGCSRLNGRTQAISDEGRLQAAQALMAKLQPDVLILNEALWCQDFEGQARDYAQLLGFEHSVAHLYDKQWGNAILSRFPIARSHGFRIYNRGGIVATLDTGNGLVQAGTYHPHPSRYPQNKAADFEELVALFDPSLPGFVAGDFNAISPADHPDVSRLAKGFEQFSKRPREDCLRFVEGGQAIFPVLERHGWQDAVKQPWVATIPTRLLPENTDSAMRIDHLWHNSGFQSLDAGTLVDPLADQASDHYPVIATLAW